MISLAFLLLSLLATPQTALASPAAPLSELPPLEAELSAILQRNHTSYPALQRLQTRVEEDERRGLPGTGADLLLLATGFLRNEPRLLQEYLRLHEEVVPNSVRAHMTSQLATLLDEASKRNLTQEWVVLHPTLAGEWRSVQERHGKSCQVFANGKAVSSLHAARLRVMPDVPQRLHVVCENGFHVASTVVPALSSAEIETPLTPANAQAIVASESDSKGSFWNGAERVFETDSKGNTNQGNTRRRGGFGITSNFLAVGGRPKSSGLHNLGLLDGFFARGGVRYFSESWFLGVSATSVHQRKATTRHQGAFRTVQAYALEGGVVWTLTPMVSVPVTAGLWRWHCDTRPCGFLKKDPSLTLSAGPAVQLPLGRGIGIEIGLAPGIVLGANPEPFLDFGVHARREW